MTMAVDDWDDWYDFIPFLPLCKNGHAMQLRVTDGQQLLYGSHLRTRDEYFIHGFGMKDFVCRVSMEGIEGMEKLLTVLSEMKAEGGKAGRMRMAAAMMRASMMRNTCVSMKAWTAYDARRLRRSRRHWGVG
jgi:hypothetical protein